jgi:hypothetical protein
VEEIASELGIPLAKVVAEIDEMRARMQKRYPGVTLQEADELRAIYLLGKEARKIPNNPGSVRIEADLQIRHRDIITTAAARDQSRKWREEQLR